MCVRARKMRRSPPYAVTGRVHFLARKWKSLHRRPTLFQGPRPEISLEVSPLALVVFTPRWPLQLSVIYIKISEWWTRPETNRPHVLTIKVGMPPPQIAISIFLGCRRKFGQMRRQVARCTFRVSTKVAAQFVIVVEISVILPRCFSPSWYFKYKL